MAVAEPDARVPPRAAGGDVVEAAPPSRVARRFGLACVAGAIPAMGVFAWLVNGGRSNFFQRPYYGGNIYDVQARSLLHGHWNIPSGSFGFDGIVVGGRTYMYQGPFPALLRMPILAVTHSFDGRLTQVSMMLAFAVALVGAGRLLWRARTMLRPSSPFTTTEALITGAWILAVGLGSALFFLGSQPVIYQEAVLWGTALAVVALDAVIAVAQRVSWRGLALAGVLATGAVLSRPSVGFAPTVALGVLAVLAFVVPGWPRAPHARWRAPMRERLSAVPIAVTAAVPVVIYCAVNYVKFSSLTSVPWNDQLFTRLNANRRLVLAQNGGSLFSIRYVPTMVVQYLRPDTLRFTHSFPFLDFAKGLPTVLFGVRLDTNDLTSSITATMPLFCVLAIVAGVWMLRRRVEAARTRPFVPAIAGAAVGIVPTLLLCAVADRYVADFVPFLVVPAGLGLQLLLRRLPGWRAHAGVSVACAGGLVALFVFGVWANVALAVSYQNLQRFETRPSKASIVGFDRLVVNRELLSLSDLDDPAGPNLVAVGLSATTPLPVPGPGTSAPACGLRNAVPFLAASSARFEDQAGEVSVAEILRIYANARAASSWMRAEQSVAIGCSGNAQAHDGYSNVRLAPLTARVPNLTYESTLPSQLGSATPSLTYYHDALVGNEVIEIVSAGSPPSSALDPHPIDQAARAKVGR